jgi:aspartate aminotransferase
MGASEKVEASIKKSSWIRKMFEEGMQRKIKYGPENVYDFSLGNPNLDPPLQFTKVVRELLNLSTPCQHGYMPNAGFVGTRKAVADFLNTHNPARFGAEHIVMTVGAGGGLNVVLKTILNPGEEVIIPSPYFVEYNFYLDNHQGVPRVAPTRPDFSLDLSAIEAAFSHKTKAVLINSPNNPTGRVYREGELAELGRLLSRKSAELGRTVYLISDEPYRRIIYDGVKVPSVFASYTDSFLVTSFSKDLSLAGERIGYIAVHPEISGKETIMDGLVLCNRILGFVNAPALMQRAIPLLLETSVDVTIYQRRRDMLCDALGGFGYEFVKPQGAFYLFPKSPIADDVKFVGALQDENILTVPGSGFMGPGHFRIAYCAPDDMIKRALPGFERVMKKFR